VETRTVAAIRPPPRAAVGRKEVREMTPVTGFVLLTGVGALFIWWLGFRMSRTGHAFVSHPEERKHHKAA
jgi:hypothetical protein